MALFEDTKPDDSIKRSLEIEDRVRNEQQKEMLLVELAKMRISPHATETCDSIAESVAGKLRRTGS